MAVTASQITQQIRSTAPSLTGADWLKLSSAIGKAVQQWLVIPSNVGLTGVASGVLGGGAVPTGKVIVMPSLAAMTSSFTANGLKGVEGLKIAKSVSIGVSSAINASGEYYGSSSSVGIGVDTCKVTRASSSALKALLVSNFSAVGVKGVDSLKLAKAISVGVSSILLTGVGTAAVTGSPSPIPSVGATTLFMR